MFRTSLMITTLAVLVSTNTGIAQQNVDKKKEIKQAIPAAKITAPQAVQKAQNKMEGLELTILDDAPDFEISHWVKGEKVNGFAEGKVYVMEFWATWCGPCKASMPHISELQEEYGDKVTFIGVSDEPLATVVNFLCKEQSEGKLWNDVIKYTLTTDPDESVKKDYFRAAGQRGIPCAFIIGKDSKIQWIGHPMSIEKPLAAVVNDEWDALPYKKEFEDGIKSEIIAQKNMAILNKSRKEKDWDTWLTTIDEIIGDGSPSSYNYQIMKFEVMVGEMNKPKEGYKYGTKLMKQHWDKSSVMNSLAWYVVDDKAVMERDLDFALKAAERGCELTDNEDAAILDTLARVHYEKGDLVQAVKWQQKAADNTDEGPMGDSIREVLTKYQNELKQKGG